VRTRLGRIRWVDPQAGFTVGLNHPVQGGEADVFKKALLLLDQRLPKGASVVAVTNDEFVVETPEGELVQQAKEATSESMEHAMRELYPKVRCEVEICVGDSWEDKK